MTHIDRYLHGPVPGYGNTEPTSEELFMTLNHVRREANGWLTGNSMPRQLATALVSPAAAVSALGELTPGGSLMKGFREESLGRKSRVIKGSTKTKMIKKYCLNHVSINNLFYP